MPEFENTLQAASSILAIVLVVGASVFFTKAVWPWWVERDRVHSQRNYELREREIQSSLALTATLGALSDKLQTPLHVVIERDDRGG